MLDQRGRDRHDRAEGYYELIFSGACIAALLGGEASSSYVGCAARRTVMSAYIIGLIQIHDRDEYKKYQEGFREIFSQYKGEILVVEEEPTLLEEEWPYTRTVVLRFSDENEAKRWYGSGQYQTLAQHRFRAAKAKVILAKGRG